MYREEEEEEEAQGEGRTGRVGVGRRMDSDGPRSWEEQL